MVFLGRRRPLAHHSSFAQPCQEVWLPVREPDPLLREGRGESHSANSMRQDLEVAGHRAKLLLLERHSS